MQSSLNRIGSGIGDRSGRQASMLVRVIRVLTRKIGSKDRVAIAIFEQSRVDGGRIALQRHVLFQTILEYAGDKRPLARNPGFLFDQRGQSDGVMRFGCWVPSD